MPQQGTTAAPRPPSHKSAMMQFEAFVLQSFIEPMLPSSDGVYGGGTAGSFWKSMLAEKLATEMAKSGGIGIAKHIMRDGSGVENVEVSN
ncbi:MAG: rod-binding protein [Hyphomicrobiales bacterium]|nr:rod-binding protein [Hyphomicrobiales bacterium]